MNIKKRAKQIKKERSIQHARALDLAAQELGFQNYRHYLRDNPLEQEIRAIRAAERGSNDDRKNG